MNSIGRGTDVTAAGGPGLASRTKEIGGGGATALGGVLGLKRGGLFETHLGQLAGEPIRKGGGRGAKVASLQTGSKKKEQEGTSEERGQGSTIDDKKMR